MTLQVTQLGQVKDLATAFHKILSNPKAKNQIYNISGERFVTFDGIAKACAKAAGAPEPELIHYNPKDFDFGGKKAFPLRDQHFFASIDKVGELSRVCMPGTICQGAVSYPFDIVHSPIIICNSESDAFHNKPLVQIRSSPVCLRCLTAFAAHLERCSMCVCDVAGHGRPGLGARV
jgi:hypothetical protein